MFRHHLYAFLCGASLFLTATASAQPQNTPQLKLGGHTPKAPRPPPPSWNGPQTPPQNGGGGGGAYAAQPYPVVPYPYDGWSAGSEMYAGPTPSMQQDPGSHVTINGKTFPPRNDPSQGTHSSVHVDGQ